MIYGIGLDVVEIERIKRAVMKSDHFLLKLLTVNERKILDGLVTEKRKLEFIAGRYAAKEAFSKAFGTGIGKLSFQDIEVLRDMKNKPVITCLKYNGNIFVSITHTDTLAMAQVVLEE